MRYKAPLSWPESLPTTPRANQSNDHGFSPNITLQEALAFLEQEIKEANISDAALYIDVEQPLVERLAKKVGTRSGACLHITYRARGYIFACDRWVKLEHNVYTLHLAFRQWRNMERWGIGSLATLMAGFEADRTSESAVTSEGTLESFRLFGLGPTATLDDAIAIYHRRAKSLSQSDPAFTQLNLAMDELRGYFTHKTGEV